MAIWGDVELIQPRDRRSRDLGNFVPFNVTNTTNLFYHN